MARLGSEFGKRPKTKIVVCLDSRHEINQNSLTPGMVAYLERP